MQLAGQRREPQVGQGRVSDVVERVAGEPAAEWELLAALDRDHREAVEEAVGELGAGHEPQQLAFGDVAGNRHVHLSCGSVRCA